MYRPVGKEMRVTVLEVFFAESVGLEVSGKSTPVTLISSTEAAREGV